jgi:hypothetical protein
VRNHGAILGIAAAGVFFGCSAGGNGDEQRLDAPVAAGTGGAGNAVNVVSIAMDERVIGPGEEKYVCQTFANPGAGQATLAHAFSSKLGPGAHHMLLFYSELVGQPGPAEACAAFEFGPTAYGSQQQDDRWEFPQGMAIQIPGDARLRMQVHYVNPTDEPVTVQSVVKLELAARSAIQTLAGNFFVTPADDILVPAHSTATYTRHCSLPFDMNLIAAQSHMHRFGVGFESAFGGEPLIIHQGASEPQTIGYTPPRFGAKGTEVFATCHYENTENFDVVGGPSFETQEMCDLSAYYYPLPEGVLGTIDACAPSTKVDQ